MNGTARANKKEKELSLQEYMNKKMKEFDKKLLDREDKAVRRFIAYSANGSYRARMAPLCRLN